MVVLPRERCPEEARLGGEAVKHSDQMCQYITITPGCSGPAGLTGKLCLWPTTAGLFIISYSHSTVLSLIWSSSLCALCTLTRGFVISPKNPKAYSFLTYTPSMFTELFQSCANQQISAHSVSSSLRLNEKGRIKVIFSPARYALKH